MHRPHRPLARALAALSGQGCLTTTVLGNPDGPAAHIHISQFLDGQLCLLGRLEEAMPHPPGTAQFVLEEIQLLGVDWARQMPS